MKPNYNSFCCFNEHFEIDNPEEVRLTRDIALIFTFPHVHRPQNGPPCTDLGKLTYLIDSANFSINAIWLFMCIQKCIPMNWKSFPGWALEMLCLGLGETCLEWWEASRRSFTERSKACRMKLNTSLVPFTLQTKTTVTDSHTISSTPCDWSCSPLTRLPRTLVPAYLQFFITQRAHTAQALVGRLAV